MRSRIHVTRRRSRQLGTALLAAALAAGAKAPADAQTNRTGEGQARADSAAARRSAASAQARFENIRRQYLPRVHRIPTGGGQCDRRIGRLCYWYDPGSTPKHHEEDGRITSARVLLLDELAELRERSPRDGWISGQLVRYLVEAGLHDAAYVEAGRCGAAEWWCNALAAFALHAAGHPEADTEFGSALALAPEEVRCEWTSVELLLPPRARRDYRRLDCVPQRDSMTDRFWWLSNPRVARATNELRAEHYARQVMAHIQNDARNPYGMRWGNDLEELVVRYGWSRSYTRSYPRPGDVSSPVTGHETVPSFHFVPGDAAFAEPLDIHDDLWELEQREAPSRYAPPWATHVEPLDAQLVALRRGDEMLVVAAFPVPPSMGSGSGRETGWRAELGASGGPDEPVAAAELVDSGATGVMTLGAPLTRALVGVDIVGADADSHAVGEARSDTLFAARTRQTLVPPGWNGDEFAVSAPLLIAPLSIEEGNDEVTLEDVLPHALAGTSVTAPGSVAIYWEAYGLPAGRTPLAMTLVVRGGERGWLRRLGDRITGRTVAEPPLLAWTDLAHVPDGSGHPFVARSVTIELPPLAPGSYGLEIRATLPDGRDATAVRLLEVRRPVGE